MTKSAAYGSRLAFGDVTKTVTAITAADNLLTSTSHGYANTQPVMLKTASYVAGTPLIPKKVYFVRDSLTNTFGLALTSGGAIIDVTVNGSGLITALTDIAQISSLSGPNLQAETIDVTTHDSPSAIREFVSGLIDPGEFTVGLVFDPNVATHIALYNDLVARTSAVSFALHFPTLLGVSWGFEGIVSGFGPIEAEPDGAVTTSVTIKLSGAPNVT
jgi:Lambda phage tail tube protein, TTP